MAMYHSWDSQNAWLRQIHTQNRLYMNRAQAERMGIADGSWVWMESHNGKVRVRVQWMEGVQENTVWTWNAIGKERGTWGLSADANESNQGFLMNHLIGELLPRDPSTDGDAPAVTNSDPITGQAAWYDLRVKITPAGDDETVPGRCSGAPLATPPRPKTRRRCATRRTARSISGARSATLLRRGA